MPYGNQLIKNNLDTGANKNSEVNNTCYSLEGSEFGSQKASRIVLNQNPCLRGLMPSLALTSSKCNLMYVSTNIHKHKF